MEQPLRVLERPPTSEGAECAVVFLPGAGDTADDFASHGFFAEVERAGVRADLFAVHAEVPDYQAPDFGERAAHQVLHRLRGRRYARIWLVGISMGGGGAMRTAAVDRDLTGLVVLAPYLGGPGLWHAVDAAGGPEHFQPSEDLLARDPYAAAWRWAGLRSRPEGGRTQLYLGYGHEDLLLRVAETLAPALPDSHVLRGGGGHKWVVWEDLWRAFVAMGFLQRDCGVVDAVPGPVPIH